MAALFPKLSGSARLLFVLRGHIQKTPEPPPRTSAPLHSLAPLAQAQASSLSLAQPGAQADQEQETHSPRRVSTRTTRRRIKTEVRSESDPESLAALLRSANLLQDRSPPLIAADKLARAGRHDLVEQVLEERYGPASVAAETPVSKTERLLVRVMAVYSSVGMVFHAERAFERIPEKTERSLRTLLAVYADNRLSDRVKECLERVPEKIGVAPGVASCNVLVRALCDAGDVVGAEEWVRGKMVELGVPPDIFTYNTLLVAYLKKRDQKQFERVVEEIGRSGLTQNLSTYNSRVAMLCRTGHTTLAGKVFEEMVAGGVSPNHDTYNALISGSCQEEQLEMAKRWFEELRQGKDGAGRAAANGVSYTQMIRLMVEKGEAAEALELCKECLGSGWALPFDVVRGLVDGLTAVGKAEEARLVVELMKPCVKGAAVLAWIKFQSTLQL